MSKGNSPAFPAKDAKGQIWTGMNLRDYIAMEALHAIIDGGGYTNYEGEASAFAKQAYEIANAMLEERTKYK